MPGGPHVCCARGRYQDDSVCADCQVVRVGEDKGLEAGGDVESIPQTPAPPSPVMLTYTGVSARGKV